MQIIDAINDMIAWLGESPIDATDPDYQSHPLYESALRILNTTSRAVQSKGWWFNAVREQTLSPTAGTITIAADVLALQVLRDNGNHEYAIRDGVLYDLTDDTDTIDNDVIVTKRTLVAFDELPETAAQYIAARAATRFVRTFDGGPAKAADVEKEEGLTFIPFHAEHIRNSRVNMYATQSMAPFLANNWYSRYRIR